MVAAIIFVTETVLFYPILFLSHSLPPLQFDFSFAGTQL